MGSMFGVRLSPSVPLATSLYPSPRAFSSGDVIGRQPNHCVSRVTSVEGLALANVVVGNRSMHLVEHGSRAWGRRIRRLKECGGEVWGANKAPTPVNELFSRLLRASAFQERSLCPLTPWLCLSFVY